MAKRSRIADFKSAAPITAAKDEKKAKQPVALEEERAGINLTVTTSERRAWREFCARHDLKQIDAFRRAWELLKRELEG